MNCSLRGKAAFAALPVCLLLMPILLWAAPSNPSANIDQWTNSGKSWQNGNLNPQNSDYREDDVVPYRIQLGNLTIGDSYTLRIEWDTTKDSKHVIDFLKTYKSTETDANPCLGQSCSGDPTSTLGIPIDPRINTAAGLHPTLDYLSTDPDYQFSMWGGSLTAAGTPFLTVGTYSEGVYSNTTTTAIDITFTANAADALLSWGGHISTHSDWGIGETAVDVPGSPYHMNIATFLDSNGTSLGSGAQDRSLKLDGYASRLTIIKQGDPVDSSTLFPFTLAQPGGEKCETAFEIAADGSQHACNRIIHSGSFTITETLDGTNNFKWALTDIACTSVGNPAVSLFTESLLPANAPNDGSVSFSINVDLQQDVTCIFTNSHKPQLTLDKVVVNNFGGTALSSDFDFFVTGSNVMKYSDGSLVAPNTVLKDGDAVVMDGGSNYNVAEGPFYGYGVTSSQNCSGTLNFNNEVTCTYTNSDIQPKLTVIKNVINNNGGSNVASDFGMLVAGNNVSNTSFAGSESGVLLTLNQGAYSVSETGPVANYNATLSNCVGVIHVGDEKVCTITNDDIGPKLRIIKNTIGGDASFPIVMTWPEGNANPVIVTSNGTGNTDYIETSTGLVTVEEILAGQPAPGWDFTSVACQEDTTPDPTPLAVVPGAAISLNGLQLGHNYTCTFTNTRRALITVNKVTNPENSLQIFGVSISGSGLIAGSSIGSISTSAPAVFEVAAGTYSVTEDAVAGWDQTGTTCGALQVLPGQLVSCTITNTQRGHLVVTKFTDPSTDNSTQFTVTASGSAPSGAPAITGSAVRNLVGNNSTTDYEVAGGGTYSVEEALLAGWDKTGEFNCTNVNVAPGATEYCNFTNTQRGHLIVHKVTDPSTDTTTVFSITGSGSVSPNAPLFTGDPTQNITGGSSVDYEVAGNGTYSVSEAALAGWDMTGNNCTDILVPAGETRECTITNTQRGHLIVVKHTDPSSDTTTEFPVTASGSAPSGAPAITGDAARILVGNNGTTDYEVAGGGTYSVVETVPAGWVQTNAENCSDALVAPGATAYCHIYNSAYGHIVVTKVVVNDNGGTMLSSAFTMLVTGNSPTLTSFPGSEQGTTVDLLAGEYNIGESGPFGYAASYSEGCSGAIAAGETKYCTITNDDIAPKLTVTKTVVNDNGGTALPSDFLMTVNGSGGATILSFPGSVAGTTVELIAGPFSVAESGAPGYQANMSEFCSGTINIGEVRFCNIVNDDIAPKLIVIKNVVNNDGRTAGPGDFTIQVSGTDVDLSSFPGSSVGTTVTLDAGAYSVTETETPGYQGSLGANCSGTIGIGETKTCVITNNDIPAGLATNSELCQFDYSSTAGNQFLLNFKKEGGNLHTLNASNPGQFYYNVVTGSAGNVTLNIPFPFVTHGATPIHVYTSFNWNESSRCFTPTGPAMYNSGEQIVISSPNYDQFGESATITVPNVPAGAYVNIHLDYGFKDTTGWAKQGSSNAVKSPYTIQNNQSYTFGSSVGGSSSTISSQNKL